MMSRDVSDRIKNDKLLTAKEVEEQLHHQESERITIDDMYNVLNRSIEEIGKSIETEIKYDNIKKRYFVNFY